MDHVIHKMKPSFCLTHFMEFRETCMNGDVLEHLMELDDTIVKKLDKGLVEDADYRSGQRAWHKFDKFLGGEGEVFGPLGLV